MSYKTYKRVVSSSLGALLATSSVIAPAEAFAEENNASSSTEGTPATPAPTPAPTEQGGGGTSPATSEESGTPATPTPAPTPDPAQIGRAHV